MDIRAYNRRAWDQNVEAGEPWTIAVTPQIVDAARGGEWQIYLTPGRPAPRSWFPELHGKEVLCLAAGGGQQGPVLAAAGARVTVFDNSPRQLAQDQLVAKRDGLFLRTILGDMSDLSGLVDESFDLIVLPVANLFIPDLRPLWAETNRVLRLGGSLLSGCMNPVFYIFDRERMDDQRQLQVCHSLPYSDLTDLHPEELDRLTKTGWPLEFGHSLEDQIGGQLRIGFVIKGFYEDRDPRCVLSDYTPIYLATWSVKAKTLAVRES